MAGHTDADAVREFLLQDVIQQAVVVSVNVQLVGVGSQRPVVDFAAFSGHKMCGPNGVGVLYGKAGS